MDCSTTDCGRIGVVDICTDAGRRVATIERRSEERRKHVLSCTLQQ